MKVRLLLGNAEIAEVRTSPNLSGFATTLPAISNDAGRVKSFFKFFYLLITEFAHTSPACKAPRPSWNELHRGRLGG
jgi:hypothetical protein